MRACCRYTRRRPERTHGGALNLHTGGLCLVSFSLSLSLSSLSSPLFSSLLSSLLSFVPSSYLLFPLFFSRFSPLFLFLFLFSFSFFFFFFFFSCSCSCSFSVSFSFSSFFFPPFYSLFSSLPFTPTKTVQSTDQQTRRPTLRRLNMMWRTVRSQQLPTNCTECSHLSSSLLFSPPSSFPTTPRIERGDFFFTGIFPARELFFITVLN